MVIDACVARFPQFIESGYLPKILHFVNKVTCCFFGFA